jgi:hypothetical protein
MRAYVADRRRGPAAVLTCGFRPPATAQGGPELTPGLVSSCSPGVPTIVGLHRTLGDPSHG